MELYEYTNNKLDDVFYSFARKYNADVAFREIHRFGLPRLKNGTALYAVYILLEVLKSFVKVCK